jgi:phosphatidylglycerophosphatase A
MKALLMRSAELVATVFGVGFCPKAPGTAGTALAMLLFWMIRPNLTYHLLFLVIILVLGVFASQYTDKTWGTKDSNRIVVDEVAGYAVAILFLPMTWYFLLAAFFLFRVFDIVKPFPIAWVEQILPGGLGVMMDDIAAGIYTNLCLQLFIVLF